MTVGVIGATGPTGRALVARLCEAGSRVVAVGRSAARLAELDPREMHARLGVDPRPFSEGLRLTLEACKSRAA